MKLETRDRHIPYLDSQLCRRIFMVGLAFVSAAACAIGKARSEVDTVYFHTVPHSGLSYSKAFFTPQEVPTLGIRLLVDHFATDQIELTAKVWNFWGHEAGSVRISDPVFENGQAEFLLRPSVTGLGWFRVELGLKRNGIEIPLKRKMDVPNSAETYDFITFAIVPKPRGVNAMPDSPFGIMTALRELPYCPVEAQIELVTYLGSKWAREILGWATISPQPGQYLWEEKLEASRRLSERGLSIVAVIQGSPQWTHKGNKNEITLPIDLLAAHHFARDVANAFSPMVNAWEVWNEPDIKHFNSDPTDRYAAVLKAMSLGLKAGNSESFVLLGSFARDPRAGGFSTILTANEVAPYLDAYNFHTYAPVVTGRFQEVLDVNRQIAGEMGMYGQPIWLTETSLPYARNEVPANPLSAMQAQVTQLHLSYLEAISRSISPVFWFISRPYISTSSAKPSQWGMVDTQLSPLPAYPAYAVMANQLGAGQFLTSLTSDDGTAYLFADGHEEVTVVIPRNGRDRITLPPLDDNALVFDVMGNPLSIERNSTGVQISSRGYAVYVRNPGWKPVLPGKRLTEVGVAPVQPQINRDIVIQAVYPRQNYESSGQVLENWDEFIPNWSPRGYVYDEGEEISFVLNVYNFGAAANSGIITIVTPDGFEVSDQELAFEIPPGTKKSVSLRLTAPAITPKSEVMIVFNGVFSGLPVTPNAGRWKPRARE